jgi:plasmid stabilization system protein ParE
VPGQAFGAPRADVADPLAAGFLDHREHAEALQHPRAGHLQELAPGGRARRGAADVAARFLVGLQLGEVREILRALHAQQQARRFDPGLEPGHRHDGTVHR